MFDFLKHKHIWEYDSPYKRKCKKCEEEQWVVHNKYPKVGEPAYEWKTIHSKDDLKLL